jgi:transcriptional regulator with XRE-family HTH domain
LKSLRPKPYKDPPETLGEHLCKKRTLGGALQREVATQLGINASTYRNWENDHTSPAVRFVPRIVEFLGYDPYPLPKTLGERIVARRRDLGMSRRRLARRLGVDEATLRRWESDMAHPRGWRLAHIDAFVDAPNDRAHGSG